MRKRWAVPVVAVSLAAVALGATPAQAATKYKNCTELHKKYKGGVAKPGAKNKGGKTRYKPYYNAALYSTNKGLDRDKDGIACEA
ncbi:MAG: hypothetical protein QOE45_1061 [Frankiaceae bacterium]|jgi:hypothetical protein|nr:hypothetical protein [Frankiaceae bacterium]